MSTYRVTNREGPGAVKIHLIGPVDESMQRRLVEDLRDVGSRRVEVHINSSGGEYSSGMAIYHALRNHRGGCTVVVDGVAASAASVIAMAGDEVLVSRGSSLMIHDVGISDVAGYTGATKVAEIAVALTAWSNDLASIYAKRAGGTPEEWRQRMIAETWFSASQAVDIGLADSIVGDRELVTASASGPRVLMFSPHTQRDRPKWLSLFSPGMHTAIAPPLLAWNRRPSLSRALLTAIGAKPTPWHEQLAAYGFISALRSPIGQQYLHHRLAALRAANR